MRLDMNQDVSHPVQTLLDNNSDLRRDLVRGLNGQIRIHFQMHVDVILHPRFASEAFFDRQCAGNL